MEFEACAESGACVAFSMCEEFSRLEGLRVSDTIGFSSDSILSTELFLVEGMDSVEIPTIGARSSIRLEMSGFLRASMGLRVSSLKNSSQVLMRFLI